MTKLTILKKIMPLLLLASFLAIPSYAAAGIGIYVGPGGGWHHHGYYHRHWGYGYGPRYYGPGPYYGPAYGPAYYGPGPGYCPQSRFVPGHWAYRPQFGDQIWIPEHWQTY